MSQIEGWTPANGRQARQDAVEQGAARILPQLPELTIIDLLQRATGA